MSQWKKIFEDNVAVYVKIIINYLIKNNWHLMIFDEYTKIMPKYFCKDAVQTKDYLKDGLFPIVSQSKDLISGFSNDKNLLNNIDKPIIIFGDHTQAVKFIDFNFVLGADGTKVITVSDEYEPKFLYYLLKSIDLHSNKYARHYSKLRKEKIPYCENSIHIQQQIVSFLDSLEEEKNENKIFFNEEIEKKIISLQKKCLNVYLVDDEIKKQQQYFRLLRANILQDAIEGKLTADWREKHPVKKGAPDYDAETLFEKIQVEKKEKKQKPLPAITENEKPFAIPTGWKWVRLGDICSKIGSGSTPRGSDYCESGIPFFRSQNIYNEGLEYKDLVYISELNQHRMKGTTVLPNDLLLNITGGSLGRCAVVPNNFIEGNVSQHVCIIRTLITNPLYLHNFILSELFQCNIKTSGAGRQGLPKYNLEKMILPLPPLAEQNEIVASVEKHLETITQLENQIATRETTTKQLMQSILKDAFEEK